MLLLAGLLSSCASVSVDDIADADRQSIAFAPERIVISDFKADPAAFELGDRTGEEFTKVKNRILSRLARKTVEEVSYYAAPAVRRRLAGYARDGDWLITGRIIEATQGSRAARATVGFGLGRTWLETEVSVYRISNGEPIPMFDFETTGTSGNIPGSGIGLVMGGGALPMIAAGTLARSFAGLTGDVDRTAYEIAAVLSDVLATRDLLDPKRTAVEPKIRGQFPRSFNSARVVPGAIRNWARGAPPE